MLTVLALLTIGCAGPELCADDLDNDGDGYTDSADAECWDRACIPVEECCAVCAPSQGVPCGETCMELDTGSGETCDEPETCGCSTEELCAVE